MRTEEKYVYWRILSDYDIDTVECLITGKRWNYVTFVCHQSVERLLKGMHIYHLKKETPKSHNLSYLYNEIAKTPEFNELLKSKDDSKNQQYEFSDFLIDLMYYYMTDYPFSYSKAMDRFIDEETAIKVYEKTLSLLNWLKNFQVEPTVLALEKEEKAGEGYEGYLRK